MNLKKASIYLTIALILPLTSIAEEIYKAPNIKLDPQKGQTVVIEKEKWEQGKFKIESEEFQERSPSSVGKKSSEIKNPSPYWIWNPKQR